MSRIRQSKNPGRVLTNSRGECRRAKPTGTHATLSKNPGRVLTNSRDECRRAKPACIHATLLVLTACLLGVGCFQDSTAQHSAFLPLNYQSTFQTVRTCRLVVPHSNQYQLVFANAIAAEPYTSGTYPLPAGSVVVAEEHGNDPSCRSLLSYYLMAKENPGYDTAAGDWHWQELDVNQRISQDGHLTTCSSCHAKPPCSDFLCSPP